ncbi:MAG: ATP-binding cassette domain-containing protein [Proteobacteria bacterium]|nr:ATP-binding cassette domain-containing protein [Pseudomonadota bacterium]
MNIIFNNVKFYYSDPYVPVFDGISFEIDTKWRAGFIGRNGTGKTTILNLIRGELKPVGGTISVPEKMYYFPYEIGDKNVIVREAILASVAPFRKWERRMEELLKRGDERDLQEYAEILDMYEKHEGYTIQSKIEKEIVRMGMDEAILRENFANLSGGEQTKVMILSLFLRKGEYPLIDEPTNHLDIEGREIVAEYLSKKEGFLLVSHDRYFLDICTDHIVSLNKGGLRVNKGNFSEWKYNMELEIEYETRRDRNLKRQIKSMERAANRFRRWSFRIEKTKIGAGDKGAIGAASARMMKKAISTEKRKKRNVQEKKKLLKNKEKKRKLKLKTESLAPDILLSVTNLSLGYGERTVIEDFSLILKKGDRIAITGKNGSGKTTLIRAILGELKPIEGIIYKPSYISLTFARQIPEWEKVYLKDIVKSREVDLSNFRNILASMGIKGDIFERPISTFSLGEQKKVEMAFSFVKPSNIYVWDEPLNYIDLFSREQIEEVILRYQPTMLFVEHDRYFIEKIATNIINLDV